MLDRAERTRPLCFVCLDELDHSGSPARPAGCGCTDRHIHDPCLLKMVLKSTSINRTRCAVCLMPYKRVVVQQVVYHQCNSELRWLAPAMCLTFLCYILTACAAFWVATTWQLNEVWILTVIFLVLGGCLLCQPCVVICTLYRRGVPMRVERSRVCKIAIQNSSARSERPAPHIEYLQQC